MKNYLVALRPFKDDSKNGIPADINMIYTEELNAKNSMQPIYNSDWLFYRPKKDGIPIPENLKLPKELYLICKGLKKINFDFYTQEMGFWIVSVDFLSFLKTHKAFENQYEVSKLTILTNRNEKLETKDYYLLRFFQYNDNLVDWEESDKINAGIKVGVNYDYYPQLTFKNEKELPLFLAFSKIAFKRSFLVEQSVKEELLNKKFLGFDLYSLQEFVSESQKRIEYFTKK